MEVFLPETCVFPNIYDIMEKNGEEVLLEHDRSCGEKLREYFQKDKVETIHSSEPNLETIFMELTGRKLEK